ncbi:MAG: methionine--tRNA ligase subunit beta [Planctomycetia bacterium]|nr:MAG: methionine--tRNA ligase subunit beta [Planctomycetia bacterium]
MSDAPTQIQYDDFAKIDLRVGTVLTAEAHPNADKLLVLTIDLGTERRQIVAGIRAFYDPAALVGRQVVVVANLAPRAMRGMESQGMVLAASSTDKSAVVLVSPDKAIAPGARVS